MSAKRLHFILIGLIGLLFIGFVASAFGINSLLSKRANSLTALKAKNLALEQQKLGLIKAKADIEKYAELETITKSIVPEDKSQADAVREIVKIAGENEISLSSITFPASTLGAGPVSASGVASPSPSAASANKKSLSQLQAVKDIPGIYQLQIVVTSDTNKPVPYSKFISFLKALENNRRTALVSNISIQPDPLNPKNLTFTLTLNGYIKP